MPRKMDDPSGLNPARRAVSVCAHRQKLCPARPHISAGHHVAVPPLSSGREGLEAHAWYHRPRRCQLQIRLETRAWKGDVRGWITGTRDTLGPGSGQRAGAPQKILGRGGHDFEPSAGAGVVEAQAPRVKHLAVR